MNIQVKPETEELIQAYIATGNYTNADEVITKALKLLSEWEKGYQQWEQETREKLAVGIAQVEQGEVIDSDVVMARLHEKIRQARESQK
ncbi:ribbon-helix-helix domain-containing protein [Cuspidothrix issatschenkoi]|uniref:Type II toxin-antitoxin system ParD family antitoxin n=1 Tax=Cuspidothrix issatschenkoi CHARLIE-1 TaxID=2052836 RepID=A0A2S6CZC7_9CYAN|nr:type II toxin-antitoxin system ParD family antitoxin [Cuspidothrix issatschenkoi]PPJ65051.1 type II toxin-antitoxin system ParD family antitoxin [Cuspidothrix issatschenkoi CHARLIE-1]TRT77871.1 MAG: type II toxin-antitoxin system ParD family antitoxin [Microcystis aeruginosa Ma_AC_P_19900807_S299]